MGPTERLPWQRAAPPSMHGGQTMTEDPGRTGGDERLARSVTDGDSSAFTQLYERYHKPLLRYCRSILGGEADSQDAVHSAFARALAALQGDRRAAPVRPWLYRIAHNEAIAVLRRRSSQAKLSEALEQRAVLTTEGSAEHESFGTLIEDMRELPERQRRALLLRELSGLSHEEIGAALGTSTASAKQAIFEARATLNEYAGGRATPCAEIERITLGQDPRVLRSRRVRAHLRDCAACARTVAVHGQGGRDRLRGLIPWLWPAALARRMRRALGTTSGSGAGHASGSSSFLSAIGASAGATSGVKTLLIVAAVGAAAAGAVGGSTGHAPPGGASNGLSRQAALQLGPLASTAARSGGAGNGSGRTSGGPDRVGARLQAAAGGPSSAGARGSRSGTSGHTPNRGDAAGGSAKPAAGQRAISAPAGAQTGSGSAAGGQGTGGGSSNGQGAVQGQSEVVTGGNGNAGANGNAGGGSGTAGTGNGNENAGGNGNGNGDPAGNGNGNSNAGGNGNGNAGGNGNSNAGGNGNGQRVAAGQGNGNAGGNGNGNGNAGGNGNGRAVGHG